MNTYKPNKLMQFSFNLLPLVGVAFWNWSPFALFYAYWLETLAIATLDAIRILFAQKKQWTISQLFLSLKFYLVQLGFLGFYLVFIVAFIGTQIDYGPDQHYYVMYLALIDPSFRYAMIGLAAIKLLELIVFYFLNNSYKQALARDHYYFINGRIILIHIVVILGFFSYRFVAEHLNNHMGLVTFVAVFVLIKMVIDFFMYSEQDKESNNVPFI